MIIASTNVQRTGTILGPDRSRVLLRPLRPETPERANKTIARIIRSRRAKWRRYWGGADAVMCMGEANVSELVALCLNNARPAK
jgi:hypothetical protein